MSSPPSTRAAPAPLSAADLPAGSRNLYIVTHLGFDRGIGTPDELRALIEEGVLPPANELTFRLEWKP